MTGKTLHEFDLALCNYALDNIRAHMDKPDFAKYVEEFLEPPVLAHLGALGDDGEPQPLLLNEDDLFGIASNFEGGPEEFDLSWEPLEHVHRRSIDTVKEVREVLAQVYADEWARTSLTLSTQLEGPFMHLSNGIYVIHE